jgi:hypothetical protein
MYTGGIVVAYKLFPHCPHTDVPCITAQWLQKYEEISTTYDESALFDTIKKNI